VNGEPAAIDVPDLSSQPPLFELDSASTPGAASEIVLRP
jgi:hypothetical protein